MQLPLFEERHEPDRAALARCLSADVVAIDVETETRWPGTGPKVDFGLSYPAAVTVIAVAWNAGSRIETTALAAPFDAQSLHWLRQLLTGETLMLAHNAVFDFRQLSKLVGGCVPARIWDTQSMARLLHPAVGVSYSLLAVAAALGLPVPERQQNMKSQRSKLHTLPLETTLEYAQDDARLTLQIYLKQREIPADTELIGWECRAMREYCRMTARGIRLNVPYVEQRLVELGEQRDALAERLRTDGLQTPGSSRARARYLHVQKGIPLPRWGQDSDMFFTWAGRKRLAAAPGSTVELSDLSTRADVIEAYMEANSEYADQLQDIARYMEIDWLMSTLKGLLDHAALDGRLHSLVTIATESGRRASSYPHMQNWKMPAMAGVAIGDEGFTLVEIDYNNAENVMAAYISGDSNLAAAIQAEDFHSEMAAQYFGADWEIADAAERKHLRTMAKKITFGTAYGMGAERLGQSIGVSTSEAQRLLRAKDAAFANVTKYRGMAQKKARQTQALKLWTGRPVAVPSAFVAWNYICQGGVSEVLKRAIVRIAETYDARGMRSRVALDMHDALILEVAHDEWDEALTLASTLMTSITPEAINQRTTPAIRWRAAPNPAENRKKWGAFQWHPPEE
jgi:DNA polymerase I-like protein with 3'-5' exonuclease and polymerase domains